MNHPLHRAFAAAADGQFPPADGGITWMPPLPDGNEAVVAFTGHAIIASRLGPADLADLAPHGFGAAVAPALLIRLAAGGRIGDNDVTLVARGRGAPGAHAVTSRWDDHPRVAYAQRLRSAVVVHGDEQGFFTLANGLGGRLEMSIEIAESARNRGIGRTLINAAVDTAPRDVPLFAAVSPGNARSLRAFLACGFVPIGSEIIITPRLD